MTDTPNPGSKEAVEKGCTCAVLDNHHGEGFVYAGERCWYMDIDCPIHGDGARENDNDIR